MIILIIYRNTWVRSFCRRVVTWSWIWFTTLPIPVSLVDDGKSFTASIGACISTWCIGDLFVPDEIKWDAGQGLHVDCHPFPWLLCWIYFRAQQALVIQRLVEIASLPEDLCHPLRIEQWATCVFQSIALDLLASFYSHLNPPSFRWCRPFCKEQQLYWPFQLTACFQ